MRERKLSGLAVEGEKVLLKGSVSSQGDKADVENIIQAQLPDGYRLDSRLAVGGLRPGLPPQAPPSPHRRRQPLRVRRRRQRRLCPVPMRMRLRAAIPATILAVIRVSMGVAR